MQGGRHEGFAGPRGGVEDDVLAFEKVVQRGFLGGVELETAAVGVVEETIQELVGWDRSVLGQKIVQGGGHGEREGTHCERRGGVNNRAG